MNYGLKSDWICELSDYRVITWTTHKNRSTQKEGPATTEKRDIHETDRKTESQNQQIPKENQFNTKNIR